MNHKIKTKLYKERIKLKNIALTDLYPSYASSVNPERIYINENLTSRRQRLVGTANGMRKDNLLVRRKSFCEDVPERCSRTNLHQ